MDNSAVMSADIALDDLLAQAINLTRAHIKAAPTTKDRLRLLWAAAKQARDFGASDTVGEAFMELAVDVGLIDTNSRWLPTDVRVSIRGHGRADIEHVISWAMRGLNPFGKS